MPVPACKNIACEERILFALTEKIADGFLGHLPKFHAPSSNVEYIVPDKTEDWLATLRRIQPTILITGWHTPALPQEWIESPEFSLRYLCHLAGTVKHVCPRRVLERGVLVSNWGSTVNHTIAEHALLLVLGALRSTAQWNAWQPDTHNQQAIASSWHDAKTTLRTRSLRGRRVGLHGLGSIARETIKLLRPFNVTLSAFSDGVPAMEFQNCDVRQCASLEELFSTNEIIIECEALTPASRGSVTEKLLALLPDDAVFVNVGRGEVVDENALARLATQKTPDATAAGGGGGEARETQAGGGRRLRVAVDVFQQEPPLPDSPLMTAARNNKILFSPHIAGPTPDVFPSCGDFAMQNLRHFLNGQRAQIQGLVTLEIYDRST